MASTSPQQVGLAHPWRYLRCSLPFRNRRHSVSQPAAETPPVSRQAATLNIVPHGPLVIGGELQAASATQPKLEHRPLRQRVRKYLRRSRPELEKSPLPLVVSGPSRKGKNIALVTGDAESGIVLDEKDVGDDYYVADVIAVRKDIVGLLPTEIASQIFSYLDYRSLVNCELVSRRWHEEATNPHVWRDLFQKKHGPWEITPGKDWKEMFIVNTNLHSRWNMAVMEYKYLKGHTDSVYCVQFDDQKVITGSRDQTVRIWDIHSGECIRILTATAFNSEYPPRDHPDDPIIPFFHSASVLCLQFDDQILVTGSSDHSCIVWSIPAYRSVARLSHHTAGVLDVCFDANYIVSCSKDTTICIWDRATRKLVRQLKGHKGPVNAVSIRGKQIVSASGDALVKLWDVDTGECLREFKGHHRGLACVQFSEDAKTIVSGGNDQEIRVWDVCSGECVKVLAGHKDLVRTLHLDTRNRRIISGSYDASVKVWNLDTGGMVLDIKQFHSTWILAAKADYKRIVSTSQDSRTIVLDFSAGVDNLEILAPGPAPAPSI